MASSRHTQEWALNAPRSPGLKVVVKSKKARVCFYGQLDLISEVINIKYNKVTMAKLKKRKPAKVVKKLKVKKPAKTRKILVAKKVKPTKKNKKSVLVKTKKNVRKPVKSVKAKKVVAKKKTILKKIVKKFVAPKIKKQIAKKHPVKRIVKKTVAKTAPTEFAAESLFKAKIKVIGIGGGGGSIVSEIGRSLEKATFVIADTDIRALKKKSGIKYFWFGEELTHGLGTGVNVELAKRAAESAKEKMSGFFKEQDIIIFVASLGGGLGSGATQIFADAAREFGGITFGIFTMPFKFEGQNKQRIAQNALKSLRKSLNVSLVIPNEKIFKVIDQSTPITNAFSTVNKSLIESLESLIDLIYNPGIINIDFADLRAILKGVGNSAFLNTVEESGKDRVEKTCENIFKNPLLQSTNVKAEKILFNIAGPENLSMFEVEKISNHIAALNPKAKIIFGISKNTKLKNRIKTTILTAQAPLGEKIKEVAPVKKVELEVVKELPKKAVVAVKKEKKLPTPAKEKKPNAVKENKPPILVKKPQKEKLKPVSAVPVFGAPASINLPVLDQRKLEAVKMISELDERPVKKTIRRSGLEIKEAEDLQEKKRIAQEKEWEIPAFLRKVKFKS